MQNEENTMNSLKRKVVTIVTPNDQPKKKRTKEKIKNKTESSSNKVYINTTYSTDMLNDDSVIISIKGESFEVIKSKLIRKNNAFNRLIMSSSKNKPICLPDDITVIGLKYFYLYLQKENYIVKGADLADLLITAMQFHEKEYVIENKEKFQKSIDDDVVIRLLELIPLIDEKYVREEVKEIVSPYFQMNMSVFFDPIISKHLTLKFLLFLYDINDLHISSEDILVDLLFNTYKSQIRYLHSFIDKIIFEKSLEKDLFNVACKIYWNKIKSISIENAVLLSNMKLIYSKSQSLTIKRSYVKIYHKNGKEIETKINDEENNTKERSDPEINNNEILNNEISSTFHSDSEYDDDETDETDEITSTEITPKIDLINNINNNNNINTLQLLINKYLNYSDNSNIFHIDNNDIPLINSLFSGKNYPKIDIKKPIKYILIMLFFYIQAKKNYIVDEKSKSLKSYEILEFIITKYKTEPKEFYSNSWPMCLIPFLPTYCSYIYSKCGMKLLSDLYLLYHIMNRDNSKINNIGYFIRDCIHNSDDFRIFSTTVNNPELVELVYPSLLKYQNKLYEESYIVSTYSNISITPLDTKTKCKYSIVPELPYSHNFTINGIIKCYSEKETNPQSYKVTCKNLINTITSSFSLQYQNLTWDLNHISPNIEIIPEDKGIRLKKQTNKFQHCFLNIQLCNGNYHLVIKNYTLKTVVFGVTTKCNYDGDDLCRDDDSIGVSMDKNGVQGEVYGKNIRRMRRIGVKNYNIEFYMSEAGDTNSYMKVYRDTSQPIIIKDLKSPCYFFVDLFDIDSYLTLESVLITKRMSKS